MRIPFLFFLILFFPDHSQAQLGRSWDKYYAGISGAYSTIRTGNRVTASLVYQDYDIGQHSDPFQQYRLSDSGATFFDEDFLTHSYGAAFHYSVKNFRKNFQIRIAIAAENQERFSTFMHSDYPADPANDTVRFLSYEDTESIFLIHFHPELVLNTKPFFRVFSAYAAFGPSIIAGKPLNLSRSGTIKTIFPTADSVSIEPVDQTSVGTGQYLAAELVLAGGMEWRPFMQFGLRAELMKAFQIEAFSMKHLSAISRTSYLLGMQYYFRSSRFKRG